MFQVLIFVFLFYCIFDFLYKNIAYRKWEGPWAVPLLGNLLHVSKDAHLVFSKDQKKFNGGKFGKYWFGDSMVMAIFDANFMREIYLKHPESINTRLKSPITSILSEKYRGIVTADENYWAFHHEILSKSFSGKKIKSIISSIEKETDSLIGHMKFILKSGQNFETRNNLMNFNSNIVFDYVFSRRIENIYEGSSSEQSQVLIEIRKLFDFLAHFKVQNFIKILKPFYYLYLKIFGHPNDNLKKILFKYYLEHCETINLDSPRDVLDSMVIEYRKFGGKEEEKSILAMSNELILAGVETNSIAMEWFIIQMINNHKYQDKIYNELLEALKSNKLTSNSSNKIKLSHRPLTPLFNASLRETMRMYPPIPYGVGREVNEEFEIEGYKIPKGAHILQSYYSMFRDENHYNEPNEFKPERFLLESHSNNYFPYGIGVRACMGMSMSQDELYISLTNILLNFKVSSIDDKPINEKPNFGFSFRPNEYSIKLDFR
ncbi:hypothetical protein DICPUDRAFT_51478 [Dictyostelium purpureum]|uniref:Cytochrome P450 family protein n=1 Tax=Dictyostelium purpureum TaxID=5786 RepID=F1A3Z3_DICPU|nr:uncharacterized protein DICPUDRAFT_51478 [Dictyostelium purpureum]EGC29087.1 hypothetical protein DICPUDRAFT_51478 [Dictyostelium purpureum]|eukprot:XP_003294388.1 hypothetical protein DICPUDRAFT_51478 [Dictyostelium purpureum]